MATSTHLPLPTPTPPGVKQEPWMPQGNSRQVDAGLSIIQQAFQKEQTEKDHLIARLKSELASLWGENETLRNRNFRLEQELITSAKNALEIKEHNTELKRRLDTLTKDKERFESLTIREFRDRVGRRDDDENLISSTLGVYPLDCSRF